MAFPQSVSETHFKFDKQTGFYKGKVRDVYFFGDKMAMVATDRISAFDVVLSRAIPYKGRVLNSIAAKFLEASRHIVPNWFESSPHPQVSVGLKCNPIPLEMVVRAYLVGHAWREYKSGKRQICGETLPDGLKENDKLPYPIITPTTKAAKGHDEDISRVEILQKGIVTKRDYEKLEQYALSLFEFGSQKAYERGLLLLDTKYEFGTYKGDVFLMDEVHTPDSSRYFYAQNYHENQRTQQKQKQLSKEFVREWLIENGFQGKENQVQPPMTDEWVLSVGSRYIELYEIMLGQKFDHSQTHENLLSDIENAIKLAF
ncbi:MAG: phosphoribosylaminoimidazolesuccinocarboxamide synthase [Cytophagales bacterium]|nr:MAG: phosphoribosylaminoimidazolesuccinocarboxamide synthase [Cytophagales bacterium]TAF59792.1 MAG: phosphoribosylaminoimidazolesuccinocarboxamide synthase [Cytophagales bacterium]